MSTELKWLNKGANLGVIHIFDFFDNSASTSDLTTSDVWVIGKKGMGKYLEGSGCGVI
jgi:hypothetical protein